MEDCLFCKIVKGDIPSKTIYEDDLIKVFMNIDPWSNGDLLIIPKEHYLDIFDIDKDVLNHMVDVIKNNIYPTLSEKLGSKSLTLVQNSGDIQEVKHFHIHITPSSSNNEFSIKANKDLLEDLDSVYEKLTN